MGVCCYSSLSLYPRSSNFGPPTLVIALLMPRALGGALKPHSQQKSYILSHGQSRCCSFFAQHPDAVLAEVLVPRNCSYSSMNFALPLEEEDEILEYYFLNGIHSCLRALWEANPRGRGSRESGVPGSCPVLWFCWVCPKTSVAGGKK